MKEGEAKVEKYLPAGQKDVNGWKIGSLFGDRAFYNGDWLKRAAAAKGGIYGNDAAEAMYPMTKTLAMAKRSTAASTTTHSRSRRTSFRRSTPSGR